MPDEFFSQTILPSILGLLFGIIGSFFKPLWDWHFEKKKLCRERLERLINEVRECLSTSGKSFNDFIAGDTFTRIAPYLSEDVHKRVKEMVGSSRSGSAPIIGIAIEGRRKGLVVRNRIYDELIELEYKYNLVPRPKGWFRKWWILV